MYCFSKINNTIDYVVITRVMENSKPFSVHIYFKVYFEVIIKKSINTNLNVIKQLKRFINNKKIIIKKQRKNYLIEELLMYESQREFSISSCLNIFFFR